jgi:hypothetical protein
MKQHWRWLVVVLLCISMIPVVSAQEPIPTVFYLSFGAQQEFTGALPTGDDYVLISVFRLERGDTLYFFVQGGGDFKPGVAIFSDTESYPVFTDGTEIGSNLNVQYEVTTSGNYSVVVFSTTGGGDYRIIGGINEPGVLNEGVSDTTLSSTLNNATSFTCESAALAERPDLEGPEEFLMSPEFILHYTRTGANAATDEFAQVVIEMLQRSAQRHAELGFALPPSDCGEGGDTRLDVYLMDLGPGFYGYAQPDNVVGDNPNTPDLVELSAGYSHLVIDNDMAPDPADTRPPVDPLVLAAVTTAHEFHHNVQFGYDAIDYENAFYEWGAMLIEGQITDVNPQLHEITAVYFRNTDVCIGADTYEDDAFSRIYSEWVLVDSLMRDKGELAYISLWKSLILEQGMLGFYSGLAQMNTTPQEVIRRLAIRNLLLDYANTDKFPDVTVRLEGVIRGAGNYTPQQSGVQQLGVDYMHLEQPGLWLYELNGRGLTMALVGIDTEAQTATIHDLGTMGAADTTGYDDAYLLVLNTTQHNAPEDCYYEDWSVRVSDGAGYLQGSISPEVWDARQFIAPK